jgi:hypothetical protein
MVHARSADGKVEVVRYDRAGRWVVERSAGALIPCRRVTLPEAVAEAVSLVRRGGEVLWGQRGGTRFDAKVRGALNHS